jgi:O-antigen/teichoic acid export membrane protein
VVYFPGGGVQQVLAAYLAGKLLLSLGLTFNGLRSLTPALGKDWWKASLWLIPNPKAMAKYAVSTNLSSTINLLIRDGEVLWVGYFLSSLEAGYYKFALAVIGIVSIPISPLISTTFPEINRSVARREWTGLRRLLRRTSIVAGAWTLACAGGLAVIGPWVLSLVKNGAYLPSYPVILVLLAGYGTANILFWNRPLLLSLGQPNYPLSVTAAFGAVKTLLMFVLVRPFGFIAQAALLSGYFIFSVGLIVRRGLAQLRKNEKEPG